MPIVVRYTARNPSRAITLKRDENSFLDGKRQRGATARITRRDISLRLFLIGFLYTALLTLAGCASPALDVTPLAECAWHFSIPCDTNDTHFEPGAASCDAERFTLDDGWVRLEMLRNGSFVAGTCEGAGEIAYEGAMGWQVVIDGACGLSGTLTVNDLGQ